MSFGKKDDNASAPGSPSVGTPSAGAPAASGATGPRPEVFLGKGSKIVGTLTFSGPVEIDGIVEGEIQAQDRLTIGESATINAKIVGAEVIVKGTVNGDISASKRLTLKKPAQITGNVTAAVLSIEEGVAFEGKCSMTAGKGDGAKVATLKPIGAAQ